MYSALFHKWQPHFSTGCKSIAFVNVITGNADIYSTAQAMYKFHILIYYFLVIFFKTLLYDSTIKCTRERVGTGAL